MSWGLVAFAFPFPACCRLGGGDFYCPEAGWHLLDFRARLGSLGFADDLAFLSHARRRMRGGTSVVAEALAHFGLSVHGGGGRILSANMAGTAPVVLGGGVLGEVESFTCLGSIVDRQDEVDADVRIQVGRAREAFQWLGSVRGSRSVTMSIKIRIFSAIVRPGKLLLPCSVRGVQAFIDACLRRILQIHWPGRVGSGGQWRRVRQCGLLWRDPAGMLEMAGHILRRSEFSITRQALKGGGGGGRPRDTFLTETSGT